MVTIEQVELLESKVSRAIDYVKRLTAENERLRSASSRFSSENSMLHGKLDGYQKRIAELEELLLGFKKDQERIEQGIISALDRLNHFEDAVDAVSDGGAASGGGAEIDLDTASPDDTAPDGGAAFNDDAEIDLDMASSDDTVSDSGIAAGSGAVSNDDAGLDFDTGSGESAFNETAFPSGAEDEGEAVLSASADLSFPLEREVSYDEAGELENTDEMAGLDEDEFLEVLKSDRISVSEPAAAFSEEVPAESPRVKTVGGPELDIF